MPPVCWKTFPAKTTKILSTRSSSILIMLSSEYLFLKSECSFTKYVSSCPSLREKGRDLTHSFDKRKTDVPRDVRNPKVRRKDKFRRDCLNIRTLASPKVGQDLVSGGVSVPCSQYTHRKVQHGTQRATYRAAEYNVPPLSTDWLRRPFWFSDRPEKHKLVRER